MENKMEPTILLGLYRSYMPVCHVGLVIHSDIRCQSFFNMINTYNILQLSRLPIGVASLK